MEYTGDATVTNATGTLLELGELSPKGRSAPRTTLPMGELNEERL
jgi:hypothetical protein